MLVIPALNLNALLGDEMDFVVIIAFKLPQFKNILLPTTALNVLPITIVLSLLSFENISSIIVDSFVVKVLKSNAVKLVQSLNIPDIF